MENERQPAPVGFEGLNPERVHRILLVASPYDAFVLEEGGRLTELVVEEYARLHLSDPPTLHHAHDATEAMAALDERPFDLVFTMARVGEVAGRQLAAMVREHHPGTGVALLAREEVELAAGRGEATDLELVWSGDARLFVAAIKLIEDRANARHDTDHGDVRILLLVEDSPGFASIYLPLLYGALVRQTRQVMGEGLNLGQRLLRMRARPKVLLATDHEEALALADLYRPFLLGLVTDLRFPRGGEPDPDAGLSLVRAVREHDPTLPVLLQSSEERGRRAAAELGVSWADKGSPRLLREVNAFLLDQLGFGDFVFRWPDGREWGRAHDLRELEEKIARVPERSLLHHAFRNDFSNWLRARTEFALASMLRPRRVDEFSGGDALRRYLLYALRRHRRQLARRTVADFDPNRYDPENRFVRIGSGSLGGKGRGLAFAQGLLRERAAGIEGFDVALPRSAVLGSEIYGELLARGGLGDFALSGPSDGALARRFGEAPLPGGLREDLRALLQHFRRPLAVRSSGLLEDSWARPFAGIYRTVMLPNSHPDPETRLEQLCLAVKLVYASVFSAEARAYFRSTAQRAENEQMAVVVQELVGRARHGRFHPDLSGVARSMDFYPVPPAKADDGVALLALGLGHQVVQGGQALRFCPRWPKHLPGFAAGPELLRGTQRRFWALDLADPGRRPRFEEGQNLVELELAEAGELLGQLASWWMPDEARLVRGARKGGVPVLDFAPVLQEGQPPLAPALDALLEIGREGMGGPVELEFAVDLGPSPPSLGFLQLRRMAEGAEPEQVELSREELDGALLWAPRALGHGRRDDITDIVWVDPEEFEPARSRQVAALVGRCNARAAADGRRHLLLGPGRWGTSDPWLGVPARWDQLCEAGAIVELSLPGFQVEPSQGAHFFQNITAMGIPYLSIDLASGEGAVDWGWLRGHEPLWSQGGVHHLRLPRPLRVRIDGRKGRGAVLPPAEERTG